jgi:hypothetical protein
MAPAERAGLRTLVRRHVQINAKAGVPDLKVACLVAEMAAGADSIDDMESAYRVQQRMRIQCILSFMVAAD